MRRFLVEISDLELQEGVDRITKDGYAFGGHGAAEIMATLLDNSYMCKSGNDEFTFIVTELR